LVPRRNSDPEISMSMSSVERALNTIVADLEVLRWVQVAQLARVGEAGPETLAELKSSVLQPIEQLAAKAAAGGERNAHPTWQLTLERAKKFFEDVEKVMGKGQAPPNPSTIN
jgi:hypothetical protein